MNPCSILLKIGLFTLIYAFAYYFIPLPDTASIGFVFPIAYLHSDANAVEHIQIKLFLGFLIGIGLGWLIVSLTVLHPLVGFLSMTLVVVMTLFYSQRYIWLKVPFITMAAIAAMAFDLVMSGFASSISSITSKLLLFFSLATVLYIIIDMLIGKSIHTFNPVKIRHHLFKRSDPVNTVQIIRLILMNYLSIIVIMALQKTIMGLNSLAAIAIASAIVVINPIRAVMKQNLTRRFMGALLGLIIGFVVMTMNTVYPFLWIQISCLLLMMLYIAYLALKSNWIAQCAPQLMVTYILVSISNVGPTFSIDSALARVVSILLGIFVAYCVSLLFLNHKTSSSEIKQEPTDMTQQIVTPSS